MKNFRKVLIALVIIVSILSLVACNKNTSETNDFEYWNDCESLTSLKTYVQDVTNKNSSNYIPECDRIAVFDMDGTLYAELNPTYFEYLLFAHRCLDDPSYTAADADMIETANIIREAVGVSDYPSDMAMRHAIGQAKAFAGMTISEFEAYVIDFAKTNASGFVNMTYATAFYLPMLEVVAYLQNNGFTTYIVSGSDRFICRAAASDACNIPYNQIIGMDVKLVATEQGSGDGLDYQFKATDGVRRTDTVLIKNLKMNKVAQIVQEIGKQPVLSFGNSSGDLSMHQYTINNNKYKAEAYMLIANDETRDYGNIVKATQLGEQWTQYGFHIISMKDDFKTIYGYDVKKTN